MAELTKTSYVILGMLELGKRTGYEIKSLVDVSTRFFWAASYGQIYPELARLEELGLVKGEADSSNGRRRKAYELTKAGERALRAWLTSDEPLHIELRHEGALKFFFSDSLRPEEQLALVRRVGETHARVAEQLRAIHPDEQSGKPPAPLLTLEFGIAYQEFLADWCERAEERLAAGRKKAARGR
jgi:PadR family transcriptional regulator, regulatory protein AphA